MLDRKAYVVLESSCEEESVLAIFLTEELANERVANLELTTGNYGGYRMLEYVLIYDPLGYRT